MNTKEAIVSQLCENTGSHILDSGGAYGRHHERNAWKTWEELANANTFGVTESFCCINGKLHVDATLYTAWFMHVNLTYAEELDQKWREFAESREGYGVWDTSLAEEFAEEQGGSYETENTYNSESSLSQCLLVVTFDCPEGYSTKYALVATHNGCDVRSGYSQFKVYELDEGYLQSHWLTELVAGDAYWSDGQAAKERCIEFEYEDSIERTLGNLANTNKNDEATRELAKQTAQKNRQEAFEEFCEAQEDECFIVDGDKAYWWDTAEATEVHVVA